MKKVISTTEIATKCALSMIRRTFGLYGFSAIICAKNTLMDYVDQT